MVYEFFFANAWSRLSSQQSKIQFEVRVENTCIYTVYNCKINIWVMTENIHTTLMDEKGAKNIPTKTKLEDAPQLKRWSYQIFHSIWILEILKMKLKVNELKTCLKRNLIKVCPTHLANMAWTGRVCRGWEETHWGLHETRTFLTFETFLFKDTCTYSKGRRIRTTPTENHSTKSWPVFTGNKCKILHHLWRGVHQR